MNRKRNRHALRMLALATMSGLGLHFATDEDTLAGGGGGDPPAKDKKDKTPPKEEDKPKKLELTEDELATKIKAAKDEAKAESDAARKAEREAAEKAELEKKGETQKLLDKEREDRKAADEKIAALELKSKRADAKEKLRQYLEKNHKDHVAALDDIALHVAVDTDTKDDEIAKRIKDAATGFVERNPRKEGMNVAPPANQPRKTTRKDDDEDTNGQPKPMRVTGAASRY